MKKFAKFFLLAVICFLFMWLAYAQDWGEPHYNSVIWTEKCMCWMPMIEVIDRMFLILMWFILLILSICTIFLQEKLKKLGCKSKLINIPVLNLYLLFDNTVWKLWFYIMVFCIWFLMYGIYVNRNWCCNYSTPFKYCILTVGIFSLLALLVIIGIMSHKLEKKSWWDNKNLE
jgi:hypothetical protein